MTTMTAKPGLVQLAGRAAPVVLTAYTAAIFIDSLRYKFTDHPKTQEIFGRLDAWVGSLGAPGLFGHTGLFSQYVIGTGEILASGLLIAGLVPGLSRLSALGALLGLASMPPRSISSSTAITPGPPPLVTMASRSPGSRRLRASVSTVSNSSSTPSTRRIPARPSAAV